MLDIFLSQDMNNLLKNKYIVFLGDSNIRALYKDFLCLLSESKLISEKALQKKMENSLYGDRLTYHGAKSNGRDYREERFGKVKKTSVSFYFLTRVYNEYVEDVLNAISSYQKPDVLVVNCCLWDVTRWGTNGVVNYKKNMQTLLKRLKVLFPDCLVIWVTTPPISSSVTGGFLVKELQFLQYSLRFHVMEANHYARKVIRENGFDLLDSHYHLKMQIHRRTKDGVHWLPPAVRYVTNLLLTHISLAWNFPLPHRYESPLFDESLSLIEDQISEPVKEEPVEQVQLLVDQEILAGNKDKENCDTPKLPPKQQKRSRPNQKAKAKHNSTHHDYMKKVQHKERCQRIRKWQPTATTHAYKDFTPDQSLSTSFHDSDYRLQNDSDYRSQSNSDYRSQIDSDYRSQNDSGYFPSPAEASLSNESFRSNQRKFSFDGLGQSEYNSHGHPLPNYRVQQQSYALRAQQNQSFADQCTWGAYQSYNARQLIGQYSSWSHSQSGRGLLQRPYSYPHVAPGQSLHPKYDFTSDDFSAF